MEKPRLSNNLLNVSDINTIWNEKDRDYPIENFFISNDDATKEDFTRLEFSGCRLEKNRYMWCDYSKSSFVDVVFIRCDFSNSIFEGAYFKRCEFIECKFTGCNMNNSVLKDCIASETIFTFTNLSSSLLEDVEFINDDFTDAILSEIKHKKWKATGTRFIRTSFFKTSLKGFNLSECELLDFILSDTMTEIRGAKISPVQAMEVARLIGAVIV